MLIRAILLLVITFDSCLCTGESIISVKIDSVLQGEYYLAENGLIEKAIFSEKGLEADTIIYGYTTIGKVNISLRGRGEVTGFNEELEQKRMDDIIFQDSFLHEKGIVFPLPFINPSELGDMVTIFSVCDTYKVESNGVEKTIRFDSIFQRIGFRSLIEGYIPDLTIVKKYRILLDGGKILEETFDFDGGLLIRNYRYDKENRLTSIVYNCTYDDKSKYSETKQFSYRRL